MPCRLFPILLDSSCRQVPIFFLFPKVIQVSPPLVGIGKVSACIGFFSYRFHPPLPPLLRHSGRTLFLFTKEIRKRVSILVVGHAALSFFPRENRDRAFPLFVFERDDTPLALFFSFSAARA